MDAARVQSALKDLGQPTYRWEQVRKAVFDQAVPSYDLIAGLPASVREVLEERSPLLSLQERRLEASPDGRAYKALLELRGGGLVETVLLRPSPTRWTACLSSQIGCAVACTFCATGLMGLTRSLAPEEISDQVLFWRQFMRSKGLGGRLDNVVYMGMGEPFSCYEQVSASLRTLLDQKLFGLGARHISVSTSGVAPRIEDFGRDFPQVNLAISLHSADDELRSRLVPMNRAYPLARLAASLRVYLERTNRKLFFEYVLLKGENDRPRDARALTAWLKGLGPSRLLHVNLILFNQTDTPHSSAEESGARRFQEEIMAAGLKATVRQNLGRDIGGACGQLAALENAV